MINDPSYTTTIQNMRRRTTRLDRENSLLTRTPKAYRDCLCRTCQTPKPLCPRFTAKQEVE